MPTNSCIQVLMLAACIALPGCGEQTTSRPSPSASNAPAATTSLENTEPATSDAITTARQNETGQSTQEYWSRCVEINEEFVSSKQELWFKSMRPSEIGKALRNAASQLRSLDQSNVDGEIIDHVNAVTRGYEDMAGIIEKEGSRAIWNEAATIGLFLLEIAISRRQSNPLDSEGAVADAGNIPVGVGSFSESAFNFKNAAEGEVKNKAMDLIESEVTVIRHVRETYGVNLKPW